MALLFRGLIDMFRDKGVLLSVVALFISGFFFRCANPSSPTGGPIDTIPPKVLNVTPKLFTTNFNAKEIVIEFDEYVTLKEVTKQVLYSPTIEPTPEIKTKGRSVVISFLAPLDSATTYKIDFGQAIVDNNEGNPLMNFSYVFSTGEVIDSLVMSGQVIDAFTSDSVLSALVLLYDARQDTTVADSVLFRSTPASIARTDSMGVYLATNLKPIDYRVYAILEEASNSKYERGSDKVAFLDSAVNPLTLPPFRAWFNPLRGKIEATPQVVIRLFGESSGLKRQSLTKSHRPQKNVLSFEFNEKNPKIDSIFVDSLSLDSAIVKSSEFGDTITYFFPMIDREMPDSIKGFISYWSTTPDSLEADTLITSNFVYGHREIEVKLKKDELPKNPFKVTSSAVRVLNPYDDIIFKFDYPLHSIDTSGFELEMLIVDKNASAKDGRGARGRAPAPAPAKVDSTASAQREVAEPKYERVPFLFERDSADILSWRLKSDWEPKGSYTLVILDSTFVNVAAERNDSITASFTIMDPEEFGVVMLNITDRDSTVNYIVSLTDSKAQKDFKVELEADSSVLVFDYVQPGSYKIKVIEDANRNLKWDAGDVVARVQPERIAIYKDERGVSKLEVKKNWELEMNVNLKELFGPRPKPWKMVVDSTLLSHYKVDSLQLTSLDSLDVEADSLTLLADSLPIVRDTIAIEVDSVGVSQ